MGILWLDSFPVTIRPLVGRPSISSHDEKDVIRNEIFIFAVSAITPLLVSPHPQALFTSP